MFKIEPPYEKILSFKGDLGLTPEMLEALDPYRPLFTSRKDEFARRFMDVFMAISRARPILEGERKPGIIGHVKARWFESLFTRDWDRGFINYLWRSGLRHVEVNVDQGLVNLGYCTARHFCHGIIQREAPPEAREGLILTVDKMLDLCLLVETNAYLEATTRCDKEVIKGISHQLRNPITVIGGNILRLQKFAGEESPEREVYEHIMEENRRLERLVADLGVYIETFNRTRREEASSLEDILKKVLERMKGRLGEGGVKVEIELDGSAPDVLGDPKNFETMFYYVLENAFEALDPEKPYIRIESEPSPPHRVLVEIFNTGASLDAARVGEVFEPFYSSKTASTGFGLTIAQLAAAREHASISLEPVPGEGTRCLMSLPAAY